MGKIRIKQVSAELEKLVKTREKPAAQELKKAQKSREKKQAKKEPKKEGLHVPGLKAGERAVAPAPTEQELLQPPTRLPQRKLPVGTRARQQPRRSARYKKLIKIIEREKSSDKIKGLTLEKAVKLAKDTSTTKFNGSIEAHINVTKTGLRAAVSLPYSTGKQRRVLILTSDPTSLKKSLKTLTAPSTLILNVAGPEKIAQIKNSDSTPEVDEIWAMPEIMKEIATIARILGPAGLMPNPKKNTIVKDTAAIRAKVEELSKGKITLETERKAPVIHAVLGKADMKEGQLTANLEAILTAIDPKQIKKVTLASTMGPGIKVSLSQP